jgi:hypothetical protein
VATDDTIGSRSPVSDRRRYLASALRAAVLVEAALVLVQAVLAGRLLTGESDARALHGYLGTEVLTLVALIQLVLAVLVWRPGNGPGWPALASLALVGALGFQIVLGYEGQVSLHVPLGVAIFGLTVALAVGTGRLTRRT